MKNKLVYIILVGIITTFACSDDLNVVNPNQLTADSFFKTEEQALASVNAIYASLQSPDLYVREYFFLHDCLSDDNDSGGGQLESVRAAVLNHTFDTSNKLVVEVWRGLYRVILKANFAIENLPEAEGITEELKNRLLGEAHFLRAWGYFELVSLWGGVPLYTEPAQSPDGKSRASEDEVYDLILADLDIAENNLLLKSDTEDVRVAKGTAQALKGKAHMFRGNYSAAKTELEKVINSGQYALTDRFSDNFEEETEYNSESLFEVYFSLDQGSGGMWNADATGVADITMRAQEYGPTSWRNLIPSQTLIDEFEEGDPRFSYTFWSIGDFYNNDTEELTADQVQGNNPEVSWRKYSNLYKAGGEQFARSGINFRVMRLADVYLMLAEAENELNGPNAQALDYLNMTRNRADVNMPNYPTAEYPTSTKEEFFAAIQHERRVELSSEQIRNRDIRRWRRAGKLTSEPISTYQSKYDLLPLPTVEIDNNSALSSADQNPGY